MKNSDKIFASLMVLVIILVCVSYAWTMHKYFENWQSASNFGESFGLLNALFSGLALIGVVFAVSMQSRELGLQREEISRSTEELKKSAEAQRKSELMLRESNRLSVLAGMIYAETAIMNSYPENDHRHKSAFSKIREIEKELVKAGAHEDT